MRIYKYLIVLVSFVFFCGCSSMVSSVSTPFYETGLTTAEVQDISSSYCASVDSDDTNSEATCGLLLEKSLAINPKGKPRPKPCGGVSNCDLPNLQGVKGLYIPGKVLNPVIRFLDKNGKVTNKVATTNYMNTEDGDFTFIVLENAVSGEGSVQFGIKLEDTGQYLKFSRPF